MKFNEFFQIQEAIRLGDAKKLKLTRKKSGAYGSGQKKLNDLFKGKDRLIFDIDVEVVDIINPDENPLIAKIQDILVKQGILIHTKKDYIKGIAYKESDKNKKQPLKIGRLLYKLNTAEGNALGDAFRDDPLRSAKDQESFKVVISRHPYDIAGMSTDRNWTSCMNLGLKGIHYKDRDSGINKAYVPKDIAAGSIIAYLTSSSDVHENGKMAIKRPLARILLKPHDNIDRSTGDIAYSMGKVYGSANSTFSNFVRMWVINYLNVNTEGKVYKLRGGLYSDGDESVNFNDFKSENLGKTAFQNVFYLSRTDEKFLPHFEINTGPTYYDDGLMVEIVISFDIPSNIPLETFRYDDSVDHPQFIDNIKRDISRYSWPDYDFRAFQSHAGNHQIFKAEYSFHIDSSVLGGDEKGNNYDADTIIETIEESIKYRIKNLDYIKCRQAIISELTNFYKNKDAQISQERKDMKEYFNVMISMPFIQNLTANVKRDVDEMNQKVLPFIKNRSMIGFENAYDYVTSDADLNRIFLHTPSRITEMVRQLRSFFIHGMNTFRRYDPHYFPYRKEFNHLFIEFFKSLGLEIYNNYIKDIHHILFQKFKTRNIGEFSLNEIEKIKDFIERFHENRVNYGDIF